MELKEIAQRIFHSFFVILSGSLISMYIIVQLFPEGNTDFQVSDISALLVLSILTAFTYIIFYSKKELNKQKMIFRHLLQLLSVLAIVLLTAIYMQWVQWDAPAKISILLLLVTMVYIVVVAVGEYQTRMLAQKLNQKLQQRYNDKG